MFSLRTRSREHDYVFVGRRHVENWWKTDGLDKLFSADGSALIIRRAGQSWKALLCGIPSDRKDVSSTTIRFTLLAESGAHPDDDAVEEVRRAVALWLDGCVSGRAEENPLAKEFQQKFTEAIVEQWFREGAVPPDGLSDTPLLTQKVDRDVRALLRALPDDGDWDDRKGGGTVGWVGGLRNDEARSRFLKEVWTLLDPANSQGDTVAVVAHLFRNRTVLRETLEGLKGLTPGRLIVLINDDQEVEPLVPKAPGAEEPPPTREQTRNQGLTGALRRNWWLVLVVFSGLVLLFIFRKVLGIPW